MVAAVFAFCHSPDDVRRKTGRDQRVSAHCLLPEVLQSLWECPHCPQAALAGGILGVPRAQHHPGDPSPRPPDTTCAAQAGLEHPSCSPSLSSDGCGSQTGMQIFGFRDLGLVLGLGPFLAHNLQPQLSSPPAHPHHLRGNWGLLNRSANPSLSSACTFCWEKQELAVPRVRHF